MAALFALSPYRMIGNRVCALASITCLLPFVTFFCLFVDQAIRLQIWNFPVIMSVLCFASGLKTFIQNTEETFRIRVLVSVLILVLLVGAAMMLTHYHPGVLIGMSEKFSRSLFIITCVVSSVILLLVIAWRKALRM